MYVWRGGGGVVRWFGLVVRRWPAAGKQTDPGSIHFAEMQLGWSCFLVKIVCFWYHTQSKRRFPAPSSKFGVLRMSFASA